jgi:hypothetical protein
LLLAALFNCNPISTHCRIARASVLSAPPSSTYCQQHERRTKFAPQPNAFYTSTLYLIYTVQDRDELPFYDLGNHAAPFGFVLRLVAFVATTTYTTAIRALRFAAREPTTGRGAQRYWQHLHDMPLSTGATISVRTDSRPHHAADLVALAASHTAYGSRAYAHEVASTLAQSFRNNWSRYQHGQPRQGAQEDRQTVGAGAGTKQAPSHC